MKTFFDAHEPKQGKRGKELQSTITDNESAKMQTAHGVIQGYNGQALGDETHQVILYAEAFGNGQDYGHVVPMLAGAQANGKAIGLPETYFEGKVLSADSNSQSEENLGPCVASKARRVYPRYAFPPP